MTVDNQHSPNEVLKQVNICLSNIIALTPKPGPTIDKVLNDLANVLGVTQETIHDWMLGKGTIELWQLEVLREKAGML